MFFGWRRPQVAPPVFLAMRVAPSTVARKSRHFETLATWVAPSALLRIHANLFQVLLLACKREVKAFKRAKVTVQIYTLQSFSTMRVSKSIDAQRIF